jgi:Fe-S cluster assembly protein SufD
MSVFLDSQAALLPAQPAAWPQLEQWRAAALAQALRVGFPHNKLERWKYAPLRALAGKSFSADTGNCSVDASTLPPAPRLVFVDGHYAPEHSSLQGAETLRIGTLARAFADGDEAAASHLGQVFADQEAPFASLNTALASDGLLIEIPDGVSLAAPLHVLFLHGENADGSHYLRHLITCGEHSRLTVIEQHRGHGRGLSNDFWQVWLKPGAQLQHIRVQDVGHAHTAFSRCDAALDQDAAYTRLDVDTGTHFQRHELNIALQGRNALARSGGVLWSDGSTTLDTRLTASHQAPDTACELIWRGMADGKGKVNFYGGITIDAGADGSNAALSNKNLLLGRQAQINTQPALEIYADEVKAAHGATVGQLDSNALFYLRSRGVPEAESISLLTGAFYAEALAVIEDAALQVALKAFLPAQLTQQGAE